MQQSSRHSARVEASKTRALTLTWRTLRGQGYCASQNGRMQWCTSSRPPAAAHRSVEIEDDRRR